MIQETTWLQSPPERILPRHPKWKCKVTSVTHQLVVSVLFSLDKSCFDFLPHSDLAEEVE